MGRVYWEWGQKKYKDKVQTLGHAIQAKGKLTKIRGNELEQARSVDPRFREEG